MDLKNIRKKTRISEPHFSAPHYNSWQFVIFCNIEFRKNKVEIGTVTLVIILTVPTTRGISNLFFGGKFTIQSKSLSQQKSFLNFVYLFLKILYFDEFHFALSFEVNFSTHSHLLRKTRKTSDFHNFEASFGHRENVGVD